MGVAITDLLVKKEIEIEHLSGKIVAIDAPLFLYQLLSSIRQRDGTPLMDSHGNITSHLVGISSRLSRFLEKDIKPVFVFDGKPPELKTKERERRKDLKLVAEQKYKIAMEKEDIADMKKYAMQTTRLTSEMIIEAKELISAFGVPIINAASEAEAQASYLVKKGQAYAVASQDADCLMFGTPKLIRNLSIAGKKKQYNKLSFEIIKPELIDLSATLNSLGLDQDQFIALCMLVGTDYNIGGIKGIGPKNAIKQVKQHGKEFDKMFSELKWEEYFNYPWQEVFDLIKNIPVTEDYKIKFGIPNPDKLKEILVEKHDFSVERINNIIEQLNEDKKKKQQKSLFDY